jgi:hypothetical protein
MSRCFTWFPIVVLGEPNIYHDSGDFTRIGDFTWRVVIRSKKLFKPYPKLSQHDRRVSVPLKSNLFQVRYSW